MTNCDMCDDEGVIYDWNSKGDPCPQCNGGKWHLSSQARLATHKVAGQVGRSGCVVLLVVVVVLATATRQRGTR